jgi:hypothetical protein
MEKKTVSKLLGGNLHVGKLYMLTLFINKDKKIISLDHKLIV